MTRQAGFAVASLAAASLLAVAAGCVPQGVTPTATGEVADSADMVMFGMEKGIFEDGVRRALIVADTAWTYQARQTMELAKLTVTFFDRTGQQTSVLTAGQGTYRIQTEALDARGGVVLAGAQGERLTSPRLSYDKLANLIRTDTTFVYQSPDNYLTGNGFVSDREFKAPVVDQPRGRQRSGGLLLPGQRP